MVPVSYLLTVGENIVGGSAKKDNLMPKYEEAVEKWKLSSYRWTKKPAIWLLEEEPNEDQ